MMRQLLLALALVAFAAPTARGEGYPKAYLSHVVPDQVAGGALFSVIGAGFGEAAGTVRVGDTECEVTSWSDSRIRARAPMVAMVEPVTVVAGGKTMVSHNPVAIAHGPVPELPSITELEGAGANQVVAPGDVLTLRGRNFGTAEAEVTFATDPSLRYPVVTAYATVPTGEIESWSETEIKVVVPETCVDESHVLVSLPGFVLLAPSRVACPAAAAE